MINRRYYYVILPLAIKIVRIPKFVKPFELMGRVVDPKKVGCKRLQAIFLEGKIGDYFGEYDLFSKLPNGSGIFRGFDNYYLFGNFEQGKIGEGNCVVMNFH